MICDVGGAGAYREAGERAWSWVLQHVRDQDGPWLPEPVVPGWEDKGPSADRDSLYAGVAGLAPVIAEIAQSRALGEAEKRLATAIADRLSAMTAVRTEASLYDGAAGDLAALRMLAPERAAAALGRLAELRTSEGWRTSSTEGEWAGRFLSDIIMGAAGIVLACLWADPVEGEAVAVAGCEVLLRGADRSPGGLDWGWWPGAASRGPNFSHGTAGIASALAVVGARTGRPDFVQAAVSGAQHLLSVGSTDDGGFVVPHTIPPSKREVEPVTYTWCHGPAGTSHLFAALALAGITEVGGYDVAELRRRCFRSILSAGVPQRLRPGFWDNDGRCCGTAGVGDVLLDAAQDALDPEEAGRLLKAAELMGDALLERARQDEDGGLFWRFVEHRRDPPLLPPGTSWMQGAAGIAAFLLRLARVTERGLDAAVVDRPDQWWAVPERLRLSVRSPGPFR